MNVRRQALGEEEFLATRNSLLERLKAGDDVEGWQDFFENYWRFLFHLVRRSGLAEEDARDVVQETVVAAARGLRGGRFQSCEGGSFKAWLQSIVHGRIVDYLRRRQVRLPAGADPGDVSDGTPAAERIPDPGLPDLERIWDEEWARQVVEAAVEAVKRRVSARQFQVFDLHVVKEMPVREVARLLHVNAAQVYLAKHRVVGLLREETQRIRSRMEHHGRKVD